jgi:hypothetical protein
VAARTGWQSSAAGTPHVEILAAERRGAEAREHGKQLDRDLGWPEEAGHVQRGAAGAHVSEESFPLLLLLVRKGRHEEAGQVRLADQRGDPSNGADDRIAERDHSKGRSLRSREFASLTLDCDLAWQNHWHLSGWTGQTRGRAGTDGAIVDTVTVKLCDL